MQIKYSFLVPVYNVERYINKCIDSIILQDKFKEICELILVDDGSTDDSGDICDYYAKQYTNISVIHKKNEGLLLARGTAVKESRGEYLIFIDSDDYIELDFLAIVDSYIRQFNPDFLGYGFIIEKAEAKQEKTIVKNKYERINKEQFLCNYVITDRNNSIVSKVVKSMIIKEHFDEIYSFKANSAEDKIHTAYIIKYANEICLIKDCIYHYVIRQDSIAHLKNEKDLHESIIVYEKVESVINEVLSDNKIINKDDLLLQYKSHLLNVMLDHIYKYTRRKEINLNEKRNVLLRLVKNKYFVNRNYTLIKRKLKNYNKLRFELFITRKFRTLILLDYFLFSVQKLLRKVS